MAYENIAVLEPNFCIGPQAGTYCSVDTAGLEPFVRIKNNSGSLIASYSFYPLHTIKEDGFGQVIHGVIKSIKYIGPINQASYYSGLTFYTLESYEELASWVSVVRQWRLNTSLNRLELYASMIKNETTSVSYNSNAMAIQRIDIAFAASVASEAGEIEVTTVSGLEVYDSLMLGPSTDADNLGVSEYVYIRGISGNTLTIRTYIGNMPPFYEYRNGDPIIAYKDVFIFCEPKDSDSPGVVARLDQSNYGATIETDFNGLYSGVSGADWDSGYGYLVFSRRASLYMTAPNDISNPYQIIKAMSTFNVESDNSTIITIYEIAIYGNTIYKLQDRTVRRDDLGIMTEYIWASYNYQVDSISPYTAYIALTMEDAIIFRLRSRNLTVKVTDQFGVALQNKTIIFTEQSGDAGASFDTPTALTDINGIATNVYNAGSSYNGDVTIIVETDGCSVGITGSQYIYCDIVIDCKSSFNTSSSVIEQTLFYETFGGSVSVSLIEQGLSSESDTTSIRQRDSEIIGNLGLEQGISTVDDTNINIVQGFSEDDGTVSVIQSDYDSSFAISQVFISRHVGGTPNQDTATLDQYDFISDAIPAFWSTKNPIATDFWLKIRPFAADLDITTFVYKIREVSYDGNSGWIDITSQGTVSTFDAGGGLLGIEFFREMPNEDWWFHYNGVGYVHMEVYDKALIPNKIVLDYWFRLIPDFVSPYIINEIPFIEEYDVPIDTNISFDVIDTGAGVNIDTMEVFLDQRRALNYIYTTISGGYHVVYNPSGDFYYGRTVQVSVKVDDISDNNNFLYHGWKFYVESSDGPWFNRENYEPGLCIEGIDRKLRDISLQAYGISGHGIDKESIEVHIGGIEREVKITPIVYREE